MITKVLASEKDKQELAVTAIDPSTLEDDFFDYTNVVVQKPWGHEYLAYNTKDAAVWVLHMKRGYKTSMHCHKNKKTSLMVLGGEARCATLNSAYQLRAGHGLLIDKGVFHSTEALSPDWVIVMEIETPTNKQDLIRLRDTYGRVGKRYEGHEYHNVFDESIKHFHNPDERYHLDKDFGDCRLCIMRFADTNYLKQAFSDVDGHVAHVVHGCLVNGENQCIMEVGDAMTWGDLRKFPDLRPIGDLELLVVKKA